LLLFLSKPIHRYFLTASYDGLIRAFDYSKNLATSLRVHDAPVSSMCVVPSRGDSLNDNSSQTHLVATASHDLTAQINRLVLDGEGQDSQILASLHLHTSPVSSVSSNSTGSHLLTSSWDALIGVWNTTIPSEDEITDETVEDGRRKRRKVTAADRPPRKAPLHVLKSHTARVSKVVFGRKEKGENVAYSCGFDSTVRTWDVESGLCTNTIVYFVLYTCCTVTNAG
jgi:ribosome biogenesis protein